MVSMIGGYNMTERQRQNERYWAEFCDYLRQRGSQFRLPRPYKSHYRNFGIGTYSVRARQVIKPDRLISITFIIESEHSSTTYYNSLKEQRKEIESEFGQLLLWERKHGERRVSLIRMNTDPTDEKDWSNQHEWIVTQLEKLIEVFHPRVERLRSETA